MRRIDHVPLISWLADFIYFFLPRKNITFRGPTGNTFQNVKNFQGKKKNKIS